MALKSPPAPSVPVEQNPDIKYLGRLLGDVIRETGGEALFERIEAIRAASVDRHRGLGGEVLPRLDALSLDDTLSFARGFMLFTLLANLAEDRQGVTLERGVDMGRALDMLANKGVEAGDVAALLERALIVPVLTAHPTEVRRKSIIDHRNRIADLMLLRDEAEEDDAETPEGEPVEQAILRQIMLLWQTRPLRRERLFVADEVEMARAYFGDIFLPLLPSLYARWERVLGQRPASFLKLGSWIGGDRDGNPFVTAQSLEAALSGAAETVLHFYLDQVHALGAELSISSELAAIPPELAQLAEQSRDAGRTREDEPFRRALSGIYARLAATYRALSGREPPRPALAERPAYAGPDDFLAELRVVAQAAPAAGGPLDRLIRAVETFGFHLATLDLRQNAEVHERVVAELLAAAGVEADYLRLDEAQRVALLRRELETPRLLATPFADYSEETQSELAIVRAAAQAHGRYGPASITTYIISKCESVSDLLEVHILLKEAGLYRAGAEPQAAVMAVPLFETIGDLEAAPEVMRDWLALPEVAALTGARGHQEVMVGYSDSNKDGGYLTSVWSLHQASLSLKDTFEQAGAAMQLFHGRGGAVGRGGGSSFAAIRAQPKGSVQGRIRITEQGEMIAAKYGTRDSARQHLESMVSASLLATLEPEDVGAADMARFRAAMADLSAAAFRAYRGLVYETEGFRSFFRQMTPIAEIGDLKIGSRPPSRKKSDRIEDLRAIPWVFSWAQARVMLPGWYGVGSALAQADAGLLREMQAAWPFFAATMSNLEMVLAKSDMEIAGRYAALVEDPGLREPIFARIGEEWQRTHEGLLAATGQARLLEHHAALDTSIRLRLPYIEPLNLLQIELLKRHRAGETDPRIRDGIQLTINAIATALRNSG